MPYLVAKDFPSEPAGVRFRALIERGGILQLARRAQWHGCDTGEGGWLRRALFVRRGDDCLDGSAGSRHHHDRRSLLLHPPDRPRQRTAAPGRRRYRLRRSPQCHEHDARLRGCGCRRRAYRRPDTAEEVRPPERQEAARAARDGGKNCGRRTGAAASLSHCPHRRCRQRRHRRCGRAGPALRQGRCRCDLPGSDDQPRDVRGVCEAHAGRAAARQYDRIRPQPLSSPPPNSKRWGTGW